jgi:hypothetical protein
MMGLVELPAARDTQRRPALLPTRLDVGARHADPEHERQRSAKRRFSRRPNCISFLVTAR